MTKKTPNLKQVRVVTNKKLDDLESPYAVDFHVSIIGTEPLVWRQIRLSDDMQLNDLHWAIQGAFGWENSHLHAFSTRLGRFSGNNLDEIDAPDSEDSNSNDMAIRTLLEQGEKKFIYEYDFGDSWHHEVKVIGVAPLDKPLKAPECIDGERCCPPEDCGGVYGFENFLEIMADPSHEEYAEMKEWYGSRFYAEKFSVAAANKEIRSFLKHS